MIVKLIDAIEGQEYVIQDIETDDEELDAFLFSLGCYSGETINSCIPYQKWMRSFY